MPTPKVNAWRQCSRYIRFRDALEFCCERDIDLRQFARPEDVIGKCCTCETVKSWICMDAGHWKSRGTGGGSGVYFDERQIHLQCKHCNGFKGGKADEHKDFIIAKHGIEVIQEIELKHRLGIDMGSMAMEAMRILYKEKYDELIKAIQ